MAREFEDVTRLIDESSASSPLGATPWFVTSVIAPPKRALSYTKVRTVFGPQERLNQTRLTLQSIRQHFPDSPVFLLEGSQFLDKSQEKQLRDALVPDATVIRCSGRLTQEAIQGPFKGLGEVMMMLGAVGTRVASERGFLKISGRYVIRGQRALPSMRPTSFLATKSGLAYSTICYGVPATSVPYVRMALRQSFGHLLTNHSLESYFSSVVRRQAVEELPFHVEGKIGPTGEVISL